MRISQFHIKSLSTVSCSLSLCKTNELQYDKNNSKNNITFLCNHLYTKITCFKRLTFKYVSKYQNNEIIKLHEHEYDISHMCSV